MSNKERRTQVLSPRLRFSPYFQATEQAGAIKYMNYNRYHWPVDYGNDSKEEYKACTERVVVMDVACERPIEVRGRDALRFVNYLCTRDLSNLAPDQAKHTTICDNNGVIISEAMILVPEPNVVWLFNSPADIDLWSRGIALHTDFDVRIHITGVAPLALQGPRALDVMRKVAPEAAEKKFFRWTKTTIGGVEAIIIRSGYSGEFGYEICLLDNSRALEVWNLLLETGAEYGIMVTKMTGRHVERGITDTTYGLNLGLNPFEARLERAVDLDAGQFIGQEALRKIKEDGPQRKTVGMMLGTETLPPLEGFWPVTSDGKELGVIFQAMYSHHYERYIAKAIVDVAVEPGQQATIDHGLGTISGEIVTVPFPGSQ